MTKLVTLLGAAVLVSGCALKGDVRRVERQVVDFREEAARADSARAVMLGRLLDQLDGLQSEILDSLEVQRSALLGMRGELRAEMTQVQRQLVAVQELTGQSQNRLAELRREIETSSAQPVAQGDSTGSPARRSDPPSGAGPGPEELFAMGRQQLRQGSPQTARLAFQKLLGDFPNHDRNADAQYWIGETFEAQGDAADSAEAAYEAVVQQFPNSAVAPRALYRLGLLFERAGDMRTARLHWQRVVTGYPNSEEANLARAKLGNAL